MDLCCDVALRLLTAWREGRAYHGVGVHRRLGPDAHIEVRNEDSLVAVRPRPSGPLVPARRPVSGP